MSILYKDNEQIVIEIKKLMLESKISQREIADKMNIKPQGLTKILNKKILVLRMQRKFSPLWDIIWLLILNHTRENKSH